MRALLLALACAACAAPNHLSRVPVGTYLLVVGDEPVLDVHSPFTGMLVERFEVRGIPTAVTVTREGRKAIVARAGGITVQPLFDDRGPDFHELGATPAAIATLDRRTRVAAAVPGELLVVHLRSGEILARHATEVTAPTAVEVDASGEGVLVRGEGVACHIDLGTGERQAVTEGPAPRPFADLLPEDIGFVRRHPAGRYAFVALPSEDAIAVVDVPGAVVTGRFPTGPGPKWIAITFARDRQPIGGW
jgi:hypothetical protein